MDGWMDGWTDGRMDGWMDGWRNCEKGKHKDIKEANEIIKQLDSYRFPKLMFWNIRCYYVRITRGDGYVFHDVETLSET